MVKPKSQSKKPQKRGVDFKKIKRKIGRKLPPPKNATNTEIKFKAIVLPEQSIASEKTGFAVNKKGLTLKELLQQTSHHNSKLRKDALLGIKDILLKHPAELKLHKLAVIEKLRERIGDDDKLVRETLYQLFKSVIFPGCKEDNQGPIVSLMMAYIFNAMTHLAIEVRLMAFKFFDLTVEYYPFSFSLYSEKILQNYEDMLRKNQFLEDKGKLKSTLAGLVRCLSLLPCNEREGRSPIENDIPAHDILHAFEPETVQEPIGLTEITKKLKGLLPILVSCFLDFMPLLQTTSQLDVQSHDCMQLILRNIDLTVSFVICGTYGSESNPQSFPHYQKPDMTACDEHILPRILKKLWDVFPLSNLVHHLSGQEDDRIFMLNTVITKIFLQLSDCNYSPPTLVEKFMEFITSSLSTKIHSGRVFHEKHLLGLIQHIPRLIMQISGYWRSCVLQAFTKLFKNCNPESSMKLACLSAIEEMLALERSWLHLDANDHTLLEYQVSWIQELPSLLILLDNKNPLCSKAVLRLQLRLAQTASLNTPISREIDKLQYSLRDFYSTRVDEVICYGPFIKLAEDIQKLAICGLYYFSFMDSLFLQSLVSCCLYDDIEPHILFSILEVLHSAFKAGHIQIEEYTSFHVTLLSRFLVYPENIYPVPNHEGKSNRGKFKSITSVVCSCLSQIGDDYLVFQMLEKIIVEQICGKLPIDNKCAFLRVLITLDSKPTRLSEQSIISISHVLPQYLIDISSNFKEEGNNMISAISVKRRRYFVLPSFYLFHRSKTLLILVLNVMGSWVSEVSRYLGSCHLHHSTDRIIGVSIVASVLLDMYKDVKIRQILLSCKMQIETVIKNLLKLLSSEEISLTIEERHKIQRAYDQLKVVARQ